MDAVKAYKRRRQMRMDVRGIKPKDKNTSRFSDYKVITIHKKRLDAEDVDWISTDNGTHIPLIDGKAVGGPLKGKEFKDAKESVKTANTKRRGQIDTGFAGMVHDTDLQKYNQDALKSIMEDTGYSESEARKLQETMLDYLGGDYGAYTKGKKKKEADVIDKGLEQMPKFDGGIYRGMYFEDGVADFKKFEELDIGDEIGMKSISSWSSREEVASRYGCVTTDDINTVMLSCKTNKSAVGVQHISKWGKKEAEVLAPSTAKWKVTGKKIVTKYDYIKDRYTKLLKTETWERKKKMFEIALKSNEEEKESNSRHSIVFLEVEEI